MDFNKLPKKIPVFPLSNFIMFPGTTVPLNIFEPRYLQMVNDSMKNHRMIGMIQPKKSGDLKNPDLYEIGCIGKITSFNETEDGRILIILDGICRFRIDSEVKSEKLYRECEVQYNSFLNDISKKNNDINQGEKGINTEGDNTDATDNEESQVRIFIFAIFDTYYRICNLSIHEYIHTQNFVLFFVCFLNRFYFLFCSIVPPLRGGRC